MPRVFIDTLFGRGLLSGDLSEEREQVGQLGLSVGHVWERKFTAPPTSGTTVG